MAGINLPLAFWKDSLGAKKTPGRSYS
jgi:hypothetical protein